MTKQGGTARGAPKWMLAVAAVLIAAAIAAGGVLVWRCLSSRKLKLPWSVGLRCERWLWKRLVMKQIRQKRQCRGRALLLLIAIMRAVPRTGRRQTANRWRSGIKRELSARFGALAVVRGTAWEGIVKYRPYYYKNFCLMQKFLSGNVIFFAPQRRIPAVRRLKTHTACGRSHVRKMPLRHRAQTK